MSLALQGYAISLIVYLGVNAIACWALNLQFGNSGVMNFAFILFQAAGAYTAAVLTLPNQAPPGEQYVLGLALPWPLPLVGAAVVGALLALAVGSFALRPRRRDFQATVMLVVSIIASTLVVTEQGWFNGSAGLYGIPRPFEDQLNLGIIGYGWFFVGLTAVMAALAYLVVHLLTGSPWGRRLRAMRENADAVESLGTDVRRESLKVYMVGGAIAAVSGGLLVEFIGAWSPSAWGTGETFIYFVAIIVGGLGNNFGAFFGAFLVLGVFLEAPAFLPALSDSQETASLQTASMGVLILAFLWWRPQGVFPERRRRLRATAQQELASRGTGAPVPVPRGSVEPGDGGVVVAVSTPDVEDRVPAAPALVVRDLVKEFGGLRAVDGVSFELPRGELTGLIGPNGAGKSTVLKLVAGAIRADSGQVLLADNRDIAGWSAHKVASVGVIRTFQHTSEFHRLTVLENLMVAVPGQRGDSLGGAMLGKRRSRRQQAELLADAYSLLEQFGLQDMADSYAGQLSGGQRRLVEIMRAMMAKPEILLLDEPMAGVNPTMRLTVEAHLRRLRDEGLTMLMVEHELGAVERVCDDVIVMAQGQVLTRGTMGDLRRNEAVVSAYLVG